MANDDIKIIVFSCNWCCYGGADTAGTSRMQYPPNIRMIRVMCSGRIEPQFILKALEKEQMEYSSVDVTWETATTMQETTNSIEEWD